MPSPRRLPTAAIYPALHALSQGFDQVLSAMDLLNRTGLKRTDLFEGCRILTEEAASWACYQVVEAVRERELGNWTISGQNWQQWQQRNEDSGDLLRVLKERQALRDRILPPKVKKTVKSQPLKLKTPAPAGQTKRRRRK